MDKLLIVHVFDGFKGLVEELEGFDLTESFILVEMIKEVSIFCVFDNNVQQVIVFK